MRLVHTVLAASVATVAAASSAYAMGSYTVLDVVAWNADGTVALMSSARSSSATAGMAQAYFFVDATTKSPALLSFSDTTDPDHAHQQVTQKQCEASADELTKALKTKKFAGVVVDRTKCKTADREVVLLTPTAARGGRGQSGAMMGPDQQTAMAAAAAAVKAADENAADSLVVSAWSEKLTVVLWGENGDSSSPAHASVFAGKKRVIEDLR